MEGLFNLTKWRTNDKQLRLLISQSKGQKYQLLEVTFWAYYGTMKMMNLFLISEVLEIANNFNITKRTVLRTLSAFYDPLGFI